jgi:phosphoribosylamine-glycine ligase
LVRKLLRIQQKDSAHWVIVRFFSAGRDAPALRQARTPAATNTGKDLKAAQDAAYAAVEKIHFDGAHFRRDIAAKALNF